MSKAFLVMTFLQVGIKSDLYLYSHLYYFNVFIISRENCI